MTAPWPSVNRITAPLVAALASDAAALRIGLSNPPPGYRLVDAGIAHPGGIEAGLRIAEICMGALGRVALVPRGGAGPWTWAVAVHSANPVLACLGSQYAGWSLSHGEGMEGYFALGSGPGRALAVKEPLFDELGYRDKAGTAVLVLEVGAPPPAALVEQILDDCGVAAEDLTIVLTPTQSLAGSTQIVARVLEVALHKAHELGFPLERVADGMGVAPLPPPSPDFLAAMGRTNDAIIYGGQVQLFVTGPESEAEDLARQLPSETSRDYGRPFVDIFEAFERDFYAIDALLFSPASVTVTALESGRSFHAGNLDPAMVERSFG